MLEVFLSRALTLDQLSPFGQFSNPDYPSRPTASISEVRCHISISSARCSRKVSVSSAKNVVGDDGPVVTSSSRRFFEPCEYQAVVIVGRQDTYLVTAEAVVIM